VNTTEQVARQERVGVWLGAGAVVGSALGSLVGGTLIELGAASWWLLASALALVILTALAPRRAVLGLAASSVALGVAGLAVSRAHEVAPASLERVLNGSRSLVELEGVVATTPTIHEPDLGSLGAFAPAWTGSGPSLRFELRALRVTAGETSREVSGLVRVRMSRDGETGTPELFLGETIRVTGFARGLDGPRNRGERDWRRWNRSRGIAGSIEVRPSMIERVDWGEMGAPASARRWLGAVRAGALARLDATDQGALLQALLLGERAGREYREASDRFANAGVGHLLAISGLHVGIALVGVAWLVRLTGDRPRLELALVVVAGVAMALLIPARPPVTRALLIAGALVLARTLGRRGDPLNLLGWACLATLAIWPTDAPGPGFQLTFGVVAALMIWGRTTSVTDDDPARSGPIRWLRRAALAGLIAWAVSTPIIVWHFGRRRPPPSRSRRSSRRCSRWATRGSS